MCVCVCGWVGGSCPVFLSLLRFSEVGRDSGVSALTLPSPFFSPNFRHRPPFAWPPCSTRRPAVAAAFPTVFLSRFTVLKKCSLAVATRCYFLSRASLPSPLPAVRTSRSACSSASRWAISARCWSILRSASSMAVVLGKSAPLSSGYLLIGILCGRKQDGRMKRNPAAVPLERRVGFGAGLVGSEGGGERERRGEGKCRLRASKQR